MTSGVKSRRNVTEGIINPGEREGCWEEARAEGVDVTLGAGSCRRSAPEAGERGPGRSWAAMGASGKS